ncbi:helix-turn-helix transcriptional regulator [Vagococcus intermedius]|uniref:WYL domain-containing protein n=1 Tax=Vagococcus intermedius TaxID=2991418 RepID=A0AAF0CUG6_9ENTE|nr:WYL domain-containing protein [Vagococcus intermedius]WEG73069.1 WYL domain-containing protein [Vagococcus intermedius]WEG75153.1 WYL domain-containing protein [Vagococcus intermedius]
MNSQERLLELFIKLLTEQSLSIKQVTEEYQISPRSAQRDLSIIRETLANSAFNATLLKNTQRKQYYLSHSAQFSQAEAFAISKILLATRGFHKTELTFLIDLLLNHVDEQANTQLKKALKSELFHYQQVTHHKFLLESLQKWLDWTDRRQPIIADYYFKKNQPPIQIKGLPLSIMFSEHYFYIRTYVPHHQKIINYRLDRFGKVSELLEKITLPLDKQLEDGEMRKKSVLMYSGRDSIITFRFWGAEEIVRDKFPQAKLSQHKNQKYLEVTIQAFEPGVIMWFLSQGSRIQVTSPPSLIQKIRQEIAMMASHY